jgi:hypothetical protein
LKRGTVSKGKEKVLPRCNNAVPATMDEFVLAGGELGTEFGVGIERTSGY